MRMPADQQPPFADYTGIRITRITPKGVQGEMLIRPELGNRNGVAHGGAIMTFTDNLAGTASVASLPDDRSVTTIECKVNFFAAVPVGDTAHGESLPLHLGRTTQVWQTRITRSDGKLAAIAIHTQMVIPAKAPQ
ncbi:MAG: PaaI family thioesterase [Variibacter sp.]|nr:PaaI family thioesterase [Variibacter sp.]